jgi:hypothetical protein
VKHGARNSTEPIAIKARRRDRVDVLVLVKATPQPSTRYGDTVCVAGVVLDDGPPRWIQLYPVPFRYLAADVQFKKYMKINVALREARGDLRPESAKIDVESIRCGEVVIGWKQRAPYVEPPCRADDVRDAGGSGCEPERAVAWGDPDAPSCS